MKQLLDVEKCLTMENDLKMGKCFGMGNDLTKETAPRL